MQLDLNNKLDIIKAEFQLNSTCPVMSRAFRLLQLNVRKKEEVHESLMNDTDTQDTTVLAIQEPQAQKIRRQLLTTPITPPQWVDWQHKRLALKRIP